MTAAVLEAVPQTLNTVECYQCGKCTAGCPAASRMDLMPNQVVRRVQLGHIADAAASNAIWECVSCQTCTTRCPKSVDCAGVMDWLRQTSIEQAVYSPAERRTVLFQKAFLRIIRKNGRLNELELVRAFKTSAFLSNLDIPFLFNNATLAPRMMQRGKLKLKGEGVRDRAVVERIFSRCFDDGAEG